jgi:hypothetical protein
MPDRCHWAFVYGRYRSVVRSVQHVKTIESLVLTIDASDKTVPRVEEVL